MKFIVATDYPAPRHETVLAGVFEKARTLIGAAAAVNALSGGMVEQALRQGDFTGRLNQTLPLLHALPASGIKILLVGLGKEDECTLDRIRGACASGARAARDMGRRSFVVPHDFVEHPACPPPRAIRAVVEGVRLGLYRFRRYKTRDNDNGGPEPGRCIISVERGRRAARVRDEIKKAAIIADAVCTARDLVNMPGNDATPSFLSDRAAVFARSSGLRCTILDRNAARRLGMNAFLSVSRGSDQPPRFIVLEHRPTRRTNQRPVVLIGKAVTFDSGGISLKPAQDMAEMKSDMAGGAAVLAVLEACARLALPQHVVGLIPAAENLPGGGALKPGDIVTAMSGTTIEIITTDAEGRLMLADALTYAQRYKPAAIIDIATLTGACVTALGNEAAGLMGTDDTLLRALRVAGEVTGERVWELPLWREYADLLKSDVADIKNAAGRNAGAITGGCFLKHFAGSAPWAHLDIAGTAWTKKPLPYAPKGATGAGVRLLVEVLEHWQPGV